MAGTETPNIPTYLQDAAAEAARNAEYPGTPFSDIDGDGTYNSYQGCNRAGSCAPGIGINSGDVNPKVSDWTTEDQFENARVPQDGQHIGGSGLDDGSETEDEPIRHVIPPAVAPGAVDTNDTANFVVATQQAAPGQVVDAGSGVVNQTGQTVEIGDRLWGNVPVA